MIFLFLSILSSTSIVVIFRLLEKYSVQLIQSIVINYFVAGLFGFVLYNKPIQFSELVHSNWVFLAIFIGLLFIVMFYVIGVAAQKTGIAVTSVATKMSVIIPISFSVFYYNETLTSIKVIGIIIALVAVLFTTYRKKTDSLQRKYIYLPVLLFVGAGVIDAVLKFAQQEYVSNELLPLFSAILFTIAGLLGAIFCIVTGSKLSDFFQSKVLFFGTILGIVNFGSIYFIIQALNYLPENSSIVFGVNNVGVVVLSILVAVLIFREKISHINWVGIAMSLVALWLLLAI